MSVFSFRKNKGMAIGAVLLVSTSLIPQNMNAQPDGAALFKQNCAACHKVEGTLVGPGLKGAKQRWTDAGIPNKIYEWINNPKKVLDEGDPYVKSMYEPYAATALMTAQSLNNEEIDAILSYVDNFTPETAAAGAADAASKFGKHIPKTEMDEKYAPKKSGGLFWIIIFTALFILVIFSVAGVRRALHNAHLEKLGKPNQKEYTFIGEIWMWAGRHKVIASFIVLFFVFGGVMEGWYALKGIGVFEGYRPEQPIWFSHQVHNGVYKIDCQYCHSAVEKSRHAMLPSPMVCMNCHRNIQSGTLTGTTEISKIYNAVGYDPATNQFTGKSEPIKWIKVHALPDHAYFNHSQHVNVGGLDCRQCHGEMKDVDVARIVPVDELNTIQGNVKIEGGRPTLTMGWCIECHKNANVKMDGNGYYDEMKKRLLLNKELYRQHLEDDRITVKEIGGWECSKCHY